MLCSSSSLCCVQAAVYVVFKQQFHIVGSKLLISSQAIYRAIEMTVKDTKTSYIDNLLLFIAFIQLLNF
jgi:hypothetical protein